MRVRAYLRECAPPRYAQSSLSLFLPRPFTGEREEGGNRLDGPYSFAPFPRSEREKENFICSARREALPGFFPLAPAVFSGFLSPFFFALIAWNAERTDCIYIPPICLPFCVLFFVFFFFFFRRAGRLNYSSWFIGAGLRSLLCGRRVTAVVYRYIHR